MDDGLGGNFTIIYDSTSTPSLTQVVVGGAAGLASVVSGRGYRFRLAARAFNGLAEASNIVTIHACAPPAVPSAPLLQAVTTTDATLNWTEPTSNGGCPILGYSLFVDDGVTGNPAALASGMQTDVPTLRQMTLTHGSGNLGTTYTYKVEVHNQEGSSSSVLVSHLFAVSPTKPPSGPTVVSTSREQIVLRYDQALTSNGGSVPLSYHLQYQAAYLGGTWWDLSGLDVDSLLTHYTLAGYLVSGETYSFRYRVKNVVGWSEFSDATSAVAADAPAKPSSPPTVVGDPTATEVTVQLDHDTVTDGGSPITAFRLEVCEDNAARTQCLIDSAYTDVASYTSTVSHTLTVAGDSLVTGSIHKVRYRATNAVGGDGPASDPLSVALADKPAAPASITKDMALSSRTSLSLEWSVVTVAAAQSPGSDITGYVLTATDPTNGTTWEAFNGVDLGLTSQTLASISGLVTGRAY
jgi:titin